MLSIKTRLILSINYIFGMHLVVWSILIYFKNDLYGIKKSKNVVK